MPYDKELVVSKLRRWEKYLNNFDLPSWDDIPNFGLYMEQVVVLLKEYLDYLPPELKENEIITAPAINNYVRKKVIPEPYKKKYYRIHIAYLIMICTLKQSLNIATLQNIFPINISDEEVKDIYTEYIMRHKITCLYFVKQTRSMADPIFGRESSENISTSKARDLMIQSAILGGFSKLLAEKLIQLDNMSLADISVTEKSLVPDEQSKA